MKLSRLAFEAYLRGLELVNSRLARQLRRFLKTLDFGAPEYARDRIIDYLAKLLDTYGDASATIAADFYNEIAEKAGLSVLPAEIVNEVAREQIDKAVRYHAAELFVDNPNISKFTKALLATARRYLRQSASQTILKNAQRDAKKGMTIKFARVPTGRETCEFCIMLAGRGFVYASPQSAGEMNHYHNNCDCLVVPGFGDDAALEGYDPDEYYVIYRDNAQRDQYGQVQVKATLKAMRDELRHGEGERVSPWK